MKKKIIKNSTVKAGKANRRIESYREIGSREVYVKTPEEEEAIGPRMIKWFEDNPEELCIEDFLWAAKIPWRSYYDMLERRPALKADHEDVMMLLANRREKGICYKKYNMNEAQVAWIHGRYRKLYQDEQKFREKLKAENTPGGEGGVAVFKIYKDRNRKTGKEKKKQKV